MFINHSRSGELAHTRNDDDDDGDEIVEAQTFKLKAAAHGGICWTLPGGLGPTRSPSSLDFGLANRCLAAMPSAPGPDGSCRSKELPDRRGGTDVGHGQPHAGAKSRAVLTLKQEA